MDPTRLTPPGVMPAAAPASELTPDQKEALKRLHSAAQQFEGVFLGMLMKSMTDTVHKGSIFGKESASEGMWSGMLDEQRSTAIAKSGSLGIAKIMENQLRASVLGSAASEAKAPLAKDFQP